MVTVISERVCKMLARRGLLGEEKHDNNELRRQTTVGFA